MCHINQFRQTKAKKGSCPDSSGKEETIIWFYPNNLESKTELIIEISGSEALL